MNDARPLGAEILMFVIGLTQSFRGDAVENFQVLDKSMNELDLIKVSSVIKNWDHYTRSLISLKLILYAYEMMTGLKINFHKSYVFSLSRCDIVSTRVATILNCNLGTVPLIYLRLPIKVTSLTRKISHPLFRELKRSLLRGRVMLFLEEIGSFLSTPCCLPYLSIICHFTTFRSGWFLPPVVFVRLSFERHKGYKQRTLLDKLKTCLLA